MTPRFFLSGKRLPGTRSGCPDCLTSFPEGRRTGSAEAAGCWTSGSLTWATASFLGGPRGRYAYHADLHPGFPGRKDTTGDVVPTAAEINVGADWLRREIEIIDPKALICLGKQPALEILRRYAGIDLRRLGEATGQRWEIEVAGRAMSALAAYHPSGAFQFPQQSTAAWKFVRAELPRILAS